MKYNYVNTAEIMVNVNIPTSHLNQMIEWLADYRRNIEDTNLNKVILNDRIQEMQAIYEQAMDGIAQYAEGQKPDA